MSGYWLAAAGLWGLAVWCRRYARDTVPAEGLRYHLVAYGVLYLIPIAAATTGFCVLDAVVRVRGDDVPVRVLIAWQRRFEAASAFFDDRLKLPEVGVLALLAAVHLLTCLLVTRHERAARLLHRGAEAYTRWTGPVAAGLATLAAFTLFGMQLGVPADHLRLKLKVAQRGYAEVTRDVEADLSREVAGRLLDKVRQQFRPDYTAALRREGDVLDLLERVRAQAAQARSAYGVSVPAADRAVDAEVTRRAKAPVILTDLYLAATGRPAPPESMIAAQVERARPVTAALPGPDGGMDLVADGRRKVALQLEKLASERLLALGPPIVF